MSFETKILNYLDELVKYNKADSLIIETYNSYLLDNKLHDFIKENKNPIGIKKKSEIDAEVDRIKSKDTTTKTSKYIESLLDNIKGNSDTSKIITEAIQNENYDIIKSYVRPIGLQRSDILRMKSDNTLQKLKEMITTLTLDVPPSSGVPSSSDESLSSGHSTFKKYYLDGDKCVSKNIDKLNKDSWKDLKRIPNISVSSKNKIIPIDKDLDIDKLPNNVYINYETETGDKTKIKFAEYRLSTDKNKYEFKNNLIEI
jgi:hypothetical protein